MEGYSSDGSCYTPQKPDQFEFPNQSSMMMVQTNLFYDGSIDWHGNEPQLNFFDVEKENEKIEGSGINGGLMYSLTSQDQSNHVETSEASYQTYSQHGRPTLTPAQKRENKKQSDCRYRQKLKRRAAEQTGEYERLKEENKELKGHIEQCPVTVEYKRLKEVNEELKAVNEMLKGLIAQLPVAAEYERLKEENEELKAANKMLKGLIAQLPVEALQREYITCIAQSTSKQLDHPSVSVQVSGLEMNDLQNLHLKIPINAVATNDDVTENLKNSRTGTCYDDTTIKLLMKEIDEDDQSNVCFSDFTGLDGERIKIGKYNFPLSLRPVVERIIACYGDVSATSKMNLIVTEPTYILLCASLKEMGDLQLERVTKDRILKWRDTIKDALRINFKVDFAMDHLKKIGHAYIGLLDRQKLENVAIRISKLEADLNAEKEEHAKICEQAIKISKLEADLNSKKEEHANIYEQCKVYMDAANEFNGKPVSAGLF